MNIEQILERVNEETLYGEHLGKVSLRKQYKVPWRPDDKPSLRLFKHNGNRVTKLWWRDVTRNESGDVINFLMRVNRETYSDTMKRIETSLPSISCLRSFDSKEFSGREEISYQLNYYKNPDNHIFTKTDLKYWEERHITKQDLIKENVFSVARVLKGNLPIWTYHKLNPIYLYKFWYEGVEYEKFYRPLASKYKWLSTLTRVSNKAIDNIENVDGGEILIVTKSKKDRMILTKCGFDAISVQSESTFIDETLWNEKDFHRTYRYVYSLFDNDAPGIELGKQFAYIYDTIPIFLPKKYGKDIDNVATTNSLDATRAIILSIL